MQIKENLENKLKRFKKSYSYILPFNLDIISTNKNSMDQTFESLNKEYILDHYELTNTDNYSACVLSSDKDLTILLIFNEDITVDILVHECIHIVYNIFEYIGSDINRETEEFFAYLNQFIFNEVYNIITKNLNIKIKFKKN